jgi:hypothetical protein
MGRLWPVALAIAAQLAACQGTDGGHFGEIPTEAAARAFLDRLVASAMARDLDGYCQVAGSMCTDIAQEVGGMAAIPQTRPLVAGTRVIPTRGNETAGISGGQLLVLCGTDGLGRQYRTEMLVSVNYDGSLYAINGVYWGGGNLAVSGDTGDASGGEGIECPGA